MQMFPAEGEYRDSSTQGGSVVEYTNSWLTINPYKGCPLRCAYCFRARWHPSENPQLETPVDLAVDELVNHSGFTPHVTPVSINISSTDALLPQVRGSTFRTIELLEARGLRNPFGITTKLELTDAELEFLESLKHVRPIVFVSLAFMPSYIEPVAVGPRVRNMEKLSRRRIPTVHYFRPIVERWNDSQEVIDKALITGNQYANAICYGGLRMSSEIRDQLTKIGARTGHLLDGFDSKHVPAHIENRILESHDRLGLEIPLFKHTFCVTSHLTGLVDRDWLTSDSYH